MKHIPSFISCPPSKYNIVVITSKSNTCILREFSEVYILKSQIDKCKLWWLLCIYCDIIYAVAKNTAKHYNYKVKMYIRV